MASSQETGRASRIVSSFAYNRTNIIKVTGKNEFSDKSFKLKFENPFHKLEVYFTPLTNRENAIYIRAFNWKCENEPNDVYDIKAARKFYKELIKNGFIAF